MRLLAVLVVSLMVASTAAPTAAAQGYVPICQTLCLVVLYLVGTFGGCANAEVQQTVYGAGDGCVFVNPLQEGLGCAVETVLGLAGLGPGCP